LPVYLKDVRDELKAFGRNPNKYDKYRVTQVQFRGSEITKSISYKAVVVGATNNYLVHIQFFKVDFLDEDPEKEGYKKITVDGETRWYKTPSVRSNPVNIKCSDPDFRFRFEKELYDNNGLIGNWRRYTRKTPPPPVGRPYANPKHLMGYCKHVNSLIYHLKNTGNLRE
jgi:hypothetical protein